MSGKTSEGLSSPVNMQKVAGLATLVSDLSSTEVAALDGMLSETRDKVKRERRIADLRAMGDVRALQSILKEARYGMSIFDLDVLKVGMELAQAGFSRDPKREGIDPEADPEDDRDEAYLASMRRQHELKAALEAEKLVAIKLRRFTPARRS